MEKWAAQELQYADLVVCQSNNDR
ncbi:hypothetical protein MICAG_3160007 [Microcystis aeruginosa PCC 9808]|uniref:Uncharacterized protein n=1 Tax=Microcystis aeruginosa PCC 9808 TaxID=1160284 RepID=I4HX54_MICAE|nr:hypothetical protein MICAG_3160007 [Microcystis aeruginosa PCC 9808]